MEVNTNNGRIVGPFFWRNNSSPLHLILIKKKKTLTPFALLFHHKHKNMWTFIRLAYQGNEVAIRFIIEYSSSLRDFGPSEVKGLFYMRIF
jgi:hypothetical protein